jgi:hypothetical protein
MKARYFERCLAETYQAATPATLDLVMRELRRVGLVPVGGRGRNAPDIDRRTVAAILIGLVCGTIASQVGERTLWYCKFVRPDEQDGPTLVDAIAALLSHPENTELEEIRISRTHARADFVFSDGSSVTYLPPRTKLSSKNDAYSHGGFCREERVWSSLMIAHIAIDFECNIGTTEDAEIIS